MSVNQDHQPFSRSANSAGGPLPLVPRRSSSSSKIRTTPSGSPAFDPQHSMLPVIVTVERPSPERRGRSHSVVCTPTASTEESDSSSGLSDDGHPTITIRTRTQRHTVHTRHTSEELTPTPAKLHSAYLRQPSPTRWQSPIDVVTSPSIGDRSADTSDQATPRPTRPMMYSPGVPLRLTTEALKAHNRTRSNTHTLAETPASSISETCAWPRLVRKKSGQIVKSSLKTSRSSSRTGLSVITLGGTCKSEPATPTHKAVHFDANLEHVKLFLAEQKPLAVSRDGSPTDDTSGTDSDFPSFIYGDSTEDKLPQKETQMTLVNMPDKLSLTGNVVLESLRLSCDGTIIQGKVRVRNLAFNKWVAIRFTFDSWQTTSEVVAKYAESIGPECDRFDFTIRMDDLLARIDGKILHLAVRYNVNGQDYWDNNNGNNYLAKFTKMQASAEMAARDGLANLHSRLERVVQARDTKVVVASGNEDTPLTDASLASRYSWDSALKDPWTPLDFPAPSQPTPTPVAVSLTIKANEPTVPTIRIASPTRTSCLPRDTESESSSCDSEDNDPPRSPTRVRKHRRSFSDPDPMECGEVKRTPPGSPVAISFGHEELPLSHSRFYTVADPSNMADALDLGTKPRPPINPDFLDPGSDDLSTPSIVSSSSSSRSSSPSPSDSFPFPTIASQIASYDPDAGYRHFIDKFCFFTGSSPLGTPPPSSLLASINRISQVHPVAIVDETFTRPPFTLEATRL